MSRRSENFWYIIGAFFAIYVIWGGSFMQIANAVEQMPPYLLAGIRFLIAGTILLGIIVAQGKKFEVSKKQFRNAVIAGIAFIALGNGGITWAMQYVDSGMTALLISSQPLVLLFMLWILDREAPPLKSWIGVGLGILGIYLLVSQVGIGHKENQIIGIASIFFSMLAFGAGSIFVNRADMPTSYITNTTIQMYVGSTCMVIVSLFFEDSISFDYSAVDSATWWALAYLSILAGALTFTAFNYLLRHVAPEKVATATYINPIIALYLGWQFRDELVTSTSITAATILLMGVYFINSRKMEKEIIDSEVGNS